jgi:hypothetical protein
VYVWNIRCLFIAYANHGGRYEAFRVATVDIAVLCAVTPCSLVDAYGRWSSEVLIVYQTRQCDTHPTRQKYSSGYAHMQGCTHFPKISEPPQNSRFRKGEMKEVPYKGPINIMCSHTKFNRHGDLAHGSCAPLHIGL